MSTNDQTSQEYLLCKVFLYKYTPPFTAQAGVTSSLSTFTPYSIPLDDTAHFTKYDISPFVTSYSFDQDINETTYSWSVELQDLALSYATINNKLKVPALPGSTIKNGLSFSQNTNSLTLLSEYETNANTIKNNDPVQQNSTLPILDAKDKRGSVPGPMTIQGSNPTASSTVHGLRLSDLIQEYDFISVYLYKNTTPLTNIWGIFTIDDSIDNNPLQIFTYKVTSDIPPFGLKNPLDPFLQYESVLLTKMPNGQTLFSNEFNGFVMKKIPTSTINQVDRVTISGNGWSRLFGSTRRAIKPSLFQNSLYQAGQVLGLTDVSAFQTVYAGRNISQIIRDLFDLVYRIDFNTTFNSTSVTLDQFDSTNINTLTLNVAQNPSIVAIQNQPSSFQNPLGVQGAPVVSSSSSFSMKLQNSFFNITSLIVANSYPANLFNLPQYLLSTVMKLRPFAYIEPINVPASINFIDDAISQAAAQANVQTNITLGPISSREVQVPPETFQSVTQGLDQQVLNYNSTNPVFFEPEVQNLQAYFQFLADVFQPFSPELMTPYEILDQIRSISFVEIFEQPNGQFLIRSPQYNNMVSSVSGRSDIALIRSNNLNIITRSYPETVENLVTKLFMAYSVNGLPTVPGVNQFGYCDGKLLIQNGLLEMNAAANPNVNTQSDTNNSTNDSKTTGIFGYAEYLMELANARLKTGTITCDLDNTIQVGQTFIDENKFKFGYVIGISKRVVISGTATMNLNLSYVRDAIPTYATDNSIISINTDLLPVLTDIENSFSKGS